MMTPDYPESTRWADLLHWAAKVLETDDPRLPFIASLLKYALENDGLTSRQNLAARKIIFGLREEWSIGILPCQLAEDEAKEQTAAAFQRSADR